MSKNRANCEFLTDFQFRGLSDYVNEEIMQFLGYLKGSILDIFMDHNVKVKKKAK
jgi:hypothetical protein